MNDTALCMYIHVTANSILCIYNACLHFHTAGSDFTAILGLLVLFEDASYTASVTVVVNEDSTVEDDEIFHLYVLVCNPSCKTSPLPTGETPTLSTLIDLVHDRANITIMDNDGM